MKLFWWKKKKEEEPEESLNGKKTIQDYLDNTDRGEEKEYAPQKAFRVNSEDEVRQFIESSCSQMCDAQTSMEIARGEYDSITISLKDIQIITEISDETRLELGIVADRVMSLNEERSHFQKEPSKITEDQYVQMESYGEDIRNMMKKLDDDEKYSQIIQNDMQQLEGEKASIRYEIEELQGTLHILQKLTGWAITLFLLSIAGFIAAITFFDREYDIFLYAALGVVGIFLSVIYILYQKKLGEWKLADRKLNKAITMLNRAKVRYVNITNSIEYQYTKYDIHSAYELNHIWGLYLETKRERELLRHSSKELHEAETGLIGILLELQVQDPRIWTHRAHALLDSREMVEVRHDLNVRRQKLRQSIEYNKSVMEQTNQMIKDFTKINKGYAEEIMQMVKLYLKNMK